LTWTAYIGVVYAVRQLASDALDSAAEPDLVDLEVWLWTCSDSAGYRLAHGARLR
jgi:hypothetical protein